MRYNEKELSKRKKRDEILKKGNLVLFCGFFIALVVCLTNPGPYRKSLLFSTTR